jgi:hypothetical protein
MTESTGSLGSMGEHKILREINLPAERRPITSPNEFAWQVPAKPGTWMILERSEESLTKLRDSIERWHADWCPVHLWDFLVAFEKAAS